jgi:hypothetical protein
MLDEEFTEVAESRESKGHGEKRLSGRLRSWPHLYPCRAWRGPAAGREVSPCDLCAFSVNSVLELFLAIAVPLNQ